MKVWGEYHKVREYHVNEKLGITVSTIMKINKILTRTPPGPVNIVYSVSLSRNQPGTVNINGNSINILPGPVCVNKNVCRTA